MAASFRLNHRGARGAALGLGKRLLRTPIARAAAPGPFTALPARAFSLGGRRFDLIAHRFFRGADFQHA
jgi:hypothetical protein